MSVSKGFSQSGFHRGGITMRKLLLLVLFCVAGCGGASSSPGETVKAALEAAVEGVARCPKCVEAR